MSGSCCGQSYMASQTRNAEHQRLRTIAVRGVVWLPHLLLFSNRGLSGEALIDDGRSDGIAEGIYRSAKTIEQPIDRQYESDQFEW